jgi:hypothetical protein
MEGEIKCIEAVQGEDTQDYPPVLAGMEVRVDYDGATKTVAMKEGDGKEEQGRKVQETFC